ncbi:MAG: DUF2905 domain-containing protein [Chloroflexi bacterium]|nr:MAG: DUF2905 domain-containing protein [Phototrophicales bacterium]RMF76685.1 MAG: DUF2905 domain-containing protein [Chloroflexota bacterium]
MQTIGRYMVVGGIIITLIGGMLMLFGRLPILSNLGKLPGDIRIENGRFSFFFPVVSSILISIILTIIINIVLRFINRQ